MSEDPSSEARTALIRARLRGRLGVQATSARASSSPASDPGVALLPGQLVCWQLNAHGPLSGPGLTIPLGWSIRGPLQLSALAEAVGEVERRQGALRLQVVETPEGPRWRERAAGAATLELVGLDTLGVEERRRVLPIIRAELWRTPLDLGSGPLIRWQCVRLGPEHHELLATVHHAVFDGWSAGVLVDDLSHAYASVLGLAETPPPLAQRFVDWMREQLALLADDSQAWDYFGEPRADLEPPAVGPEVPLVTFAHEQLTLSQTLSQRLTTHIRGGTLSLAAPVAATALIRAARTGGSSRLAVAVTNRRGAAQERLIGLLANHVVVTLEVDRRARLGELLEQARAALIHALAHERLPIEEVGRRWAARSGRPASELYDVLLISEPPSARSVTASTIEFSALPIPRPATQAVLTSLDWTISLRQRRSDWTLGLGRRVGDEPLAPALEAVLDALLRQPEQSVASLLDAHARRA